MNLVNCAELLNYRSMTHFSNNAASRPRQFQGRRMNSPLSSRSELHKNVGESKLELRKALRSRRSADRENRIAANRRITSTVTGLAEYRRSTTIFCYAGAPHLGEFNTLPLLTAMFADGKRVCLPVISSAPDPEAPPLMQAHLYDRHSELRSNTWGIAEPVGTMPIDRSDIELVIVPALGVSLVGDRIGYGKAYYDSFLTDSPATRLVPIYEDYLVEPFPTEQHDQRMDLIVTERRVVRIV